MLQPHVEVSEFVDILSEFQPEVVSVKVLTTTKGEANRPTWVYSPLDFKIKFGKPSKSLNNFDCWYQVYNYFNYNNEAILIVRSMGENYYNSNIITPFVEGYIGGEDNKGIKIKRKIQNKDEFDAFKDEWSLGDSIIEVIARTPGEWGNEIKVAVFSYEEVENNSKIFESYNAKDIKRKLLENEYVIAVFYGKKLVESWTIKPNQFELINEKSTYIYIKENFYEYKLYDGNIFYIDGDQEFADGNFPQELKAKFYNSNILSLTDGYSEEPSLSDLKESYDCIKELTDFECDFVLGENKGKNFAIDVARYFDCVCILNVPRDVNYKDYLKNIDRSYDNGVIVYDNLKYQDNIFTQKKNYFSVVGDVCGLRSSLMKENLSISHCKRNYSITNLEEIYKHYNEDEIEERYIRNVNVIKRENNSYICNSERMLDGTNLTNKIIKTKIIRNFKKLLNNYIFEFNDHITRSDLSSNLRNAAQRFKAENYIEDFKIVCDEKNQDKSKPENIYVDFYYKPKYLIETVHLRFKVN